MLCSSFDAFVQQIVKKQKQIVLFYLVSKLTLLPLKKQKLTKDIVTKKVVTKKAALWVHFENTIQDYYKRMTELKETEAK